jgi:hypothetical protein
MKRKYGASIGNWIRVVALTTTIGLVGYTTGGILHQVLIDTKHAHAATETECENDICVWDCVMDDDGVITCGGDVCTGLTGSSSGCNVTGPEECETFACSP